MPENKFITRPRLVQHLLDLEKTLSSFDATASVEWRVGEMANALLALVREFAPEGHPLVAAFKDFVMNPQTTIVHGVHVGSMRALLRQLAMVIE